MGILANETEPVSLLADIATIDTSCTAFTATLDATTVPPKSPPEIFPAVRFVRADPDPEYAPEKVPAVNVPATVPLDTKNVAPG